MQTLHGHVDVTQPVMQGSLRLGEACYNSAWPSSENGHGKLVAHTDTSCCTPGAGDLACCSPVRFDFGPVEPGSASSCGGAGEHCFSGFSGLTGEPAFFGESMCEEPGFKRPGSWLEGFSPFPGVCLP